MSSDNEVPSSVDYLKPSHLEMLAPASAGCLSFLASLGIVVMVSRKRNGGLSTPYRRIIFGMSVSDMISSFALMIGPFSIPAGIEHSFGIGNDVTCSTDGFLLTFGISAVPLYTCFLCLYYVCKLKFRMTNEVFARRFEWICHIMIMLYTATLASVALSLGIIGANINNSYCIYTSKPEGCLWYPEIVGECEAGPRSRHVSNMFFLVFAVVPTSCFILICIFMGMLYWHAILWKRVISKELPDPKTQSSKHGKPKEAEDDSSHDTPCPDKTFPRSRELGSSSEHGIPRSSSVDENDEERTAAQLQETVKVEILVDSYDDTRNLSLRSNKTQQRPQAQVQKLSQLYTAETKAMAASYIGAFAITYLPLTLGQINSLIPGDRSPIIVAIILNLSYFYPLGGLFNILVYTRPQVASLRRKHEGRISRLHALFLVLKTGGRAPNMQMEIEADHDSQNNEKSKPDSNVKAIAGVSVAYGYVDYRIESIPNSVNGVDGFSLSMREDEVAYSPMDKWFHSEKKAEIIGGNTRGLPINDKSFEEDMSYPTTGNNVNPESGLSYSGKNDISNHGISSEVLTGGDNPSFVYQDRLSREDVGEISTDSSDIWTSAFKRIKHMNPST